MHVAPGEAFDFLMVLPYLKPNAVIILHDIAYHCFGHSKYANVCALLFHSIVGEKHIPAQYSPYEYLFQNIGSCVLSAEQSRYYELYFRLLHLPWVYMPSRKDISVFKNHISKHYDKAFVNAFEHILALQTKWGAQEKPSIFRRAGRKIKHFLKRGLYQKG